MLHGLDLAVAQVLNWIRKWLQQLLDWILDFIAPRWRRLGLAMQRQAQTQWCWAACSASVSQFYNTASTWTQCGVADAELGQTTCCVNGSSAQCNQPWFLDLALTRTGNLASSSSGTVGMAAIIAQIRSQRPLGVRIGWAGGGGHFVVIAGCRRDDMLDVRDPWFGNSDVPLATFLSAYQGNGSWTHSFFTAT